MKIWVQSGTTIGKDERYDAYLDMLKFHLNKAARPGTEISINGVDVCSPLIAVSRYHELLHDYQIVEKLLQAQQEGYDAFCVTCYLEPAYYALREVANIPVCNIAEASMVLACLLSPNFSLLSYNEILTKRIIGSLKRYGLQRRFIETPTLEIGQTEDAFHRAFEDPEIILGPARKVAKEAIKKGVCMFVNTDGRLNMIMAEHNIREIQGIPVLEGGSALIKMTEMLVDLKAIGIDRSQLGLYTPISDNDLMSLRSLYGLV